MSQQGPPVSPPASKKPNWEGDDALEHLKKHLQTACTLELFTIPLYLYAAYSIKSDEDSRGKIAHIVHQEMLHLALAGNILCAIGSSPVLYAQGFTPVYPQDIFFEKVSMSLRPATQEHLKSFVQLEAPRQTDKPVFATFLPEYHAISEFYDSCREGLEAVYAKMGDKMFIPETLDRQFGPADWGFYGGMRKIKTIQDARDALQLIVEQGEGGPDVDESHYRTFLDLLNQGPIDCYPAIQNPVTSSFEGQDIQKVMIASDAAYCYLLLTIETVWTYNGPDRSKLIDNIRNLMSPVVKPLASFLASQQLSGSDKHAGAPFNYHPFPSTAEALSNFIAAAETASNTFAGNQDLNNVYKTVSKLFDLKEAKPQS